MKKRIISMILVMSMLLSMSQTAISAAFAEPQGSTVPDTNLTGSDEPPADPYSPAYRVWKKAQSESASSAELHSIEVGSMDVGSGSVDVGSGSVDVGSGSVDEDIGFVDSEYGDTITNEYLTLTANSGTFRYHTTGGNPDSYTDDNCRLLYDNTSKVVVRIDGFDYTYYGNDSVVVNQSAIHSSAECDEVAVEQVLSFVYNPYTKRHDTTEFKYILTNNSDTAKDIGVKLFFDIMLDWNDQAPFKIPGYGDVTTETVFTRDNMIQVWQSFDDLQNPTVVASGTLYNNISEKPDRIEFLNYGNNYYGEWDSYLNVGDPLYDTAINFYFDPVTVQPGETREVKTYYGLSAIRGGQNINMGLQAFAPAALEKDDETNSYQSNPFTVNGFVENKTDALLTNVTATLNLPEGLTTADPLTIPLDVIESRENKPVAWQIEALPHYRDSDVSFSITLSADEVPDETTEFYIHLPRLLDDYGNFPGEKDGSVVPGEAVNAKLEIVEDADCFVFTAPETGTYSFESLSPTALCAQLTRDGEPVEVLEASGTDENFFLIAELEEGEIYYLHVYAGEGTAVCDYSVYAEKLTDDAGNRFASAREIAEREEITAFVNYPCDVDVFRFKPSRSGWYTADVSGHLSPIFLGLYDSAGNLLESDEIFFKSLPVYTLTEGETYYLGLKHAGDADKDTAQTGSYCLCVAYDETPPSVDTITPNLSERINQVLGVTVYAYDNVDVASITLKWSHDNKNWFVFDTVNVDNGSPAWFKIDTRDFSDGALYLTAEATDENGNVSTENPVNTYIIDNTPPEQIVFENALSTVGANYLSWTRVTADDAAGYILYRADGSEGTPVVLRTITDLDTLFFVDTDVVTGNDYVYSITAYDTLYQESVPSVSGTITTSNDMESDIAIRNLTVTPGRTSLFVGETSQITAVIEYVNGSSKDVTSMLTYDYDSGVLEMDPYGRIRALAAGSPVLSVTVGSKVIRIPFVIRSISASISSDTIIGNGTEQLTVTQHTLEGITDITAKAEYTVDHPEILEITPDGEVRALTTGTAVITVTFGGESETIPVTVYAPPGKVTDVNIPDQAADVSVDPVLTWLPTSATDYYNVYLWQSESETPAAPVQTALTATMYRPRSLKYNTTYCWQVESVNAYASTFSEIYSFSTPGLPDLQCADVTVPDLVFSESSLTVSWEVVNNGTRTTDDRQWYDVIYLCPGTTFDANTAIRLGQKQNHAYLDIGESYRNEASFTIPRGTVGKYYVYVAVNDSYSVRELDSSNNMLRSDGMDIELCPQPDLTVTGVETSLGQIISGNKMTVTWTVENIDAEIPADANISGWLDAVYLSADETLSADDVSLGSAPVSVLSSGRAVNANNFYADKKYTASKEITVPQNVFGDYFIIVQADATDKIYENNAYNNSGSAAIRITLDPPADITVTDAHAESLLAANAVYTVTWTDVNEGSRDVSGDSWIDRVFLSTDEILDPSDAYAVADVRGARENRENSVEITVPYYLEGEYYLHIAADIARSIFEYGTYANNVYTQKVTILKRDLPDLAADSLTAPAEAMADRLIEVSFRVDNIGEGTTVENSWTDAVYLSESAVPDDAAVLLTELSHRGNLAPDGSYTVTASVRIPEDCAGTYCLFAETDIHCLLTESGSRDNNRTPCAVIEISPRRAADLCVTEASSDGIDAAAGAVMKINWTIANEGEGSVDRKWRDSVYLSTSAESPFEGQSIRLDDIMHDVELAAGETMTVSRNVILSGRLNATYYIYIVTDADDAVYEGDDENNNFRKVALICETEDGEEEIRESIDLVFTQVADLEVSDITAPSEAAAGETVEIAWKVTNRAELRTGSSSWTDTVYLIPANEELYRENGIELCELTHRGYLDAGESYEASVSAELPVTLDGGYRIMIVTDRRGSVYDENRDNNTLLSDAVTAVTPATPVDFVLALDEISDTVTAGQPLTVSWEVTNLSDAAAEGRWYDSVYLSYTASTTDIKLQDVQNPKNLGSGESYRQTVNVNLPANIDGPMYIVVRANHTRSTVYEVDFTGNMQYEAVEMTAMEPVDLTVSRISIPGVAYPGEEITVGWDVVNLSTQSMEAKMTDHVYISADDVWDIDDIPVGELTRTVSLGGNDRTYESITVAMPDYESLSKISSSLTDDMPGVPEGQYYVIVRTDVRNQVNENNKANNRVASESTLNATVPEIELGDTESGVLRSQNEKFYRFTASGSESVNVLLTCADADAVNELYISYNKVPTANNYDYRFTEPMSADHSVVIPVAQKGEYYIYIKNVSAGDAGTEFDLTVESVDYGLMDVSPKEAGRGKVTLRLTGSLLESNLTATLTQGKNRIRAEEIYYFDSSNVYATFDLTYAPAGTYTLEVDCSGRISRLEDCFTVGDLAAGELNISMNAPSSYLMGSTGSATIRYKNIGHTDIAAPVLVVDAENVMFMKNDETEFADGPMVIYAYNNDGPAGILPPGSEFAYNFSFKATAIGNVVYNIVSYDQIEDTGLEPVTLSASSDDEERIEYILKKELGTTGESYQNALSKTASYYSQFGYRTHNPDELVMLLYNGLMGLYTDAAISVSEDIVLDAGGLVAGFTREYRSAVTERNMKSHFGYGWKTPFDGSASAEDGRILIEYPEGIRMFEKNGSVYTELTGTAAAGISGGVITVEEQNGTVTTYGTNGKPASVTYPSGEKITVNYDGDRITSVVYPTSTLNFTYSGDYVTEITSSTGEWVTYTYDGDYLTSVTTEKGTAYYAYDTKSVGPARNALTGVTHYDGNTTSFAYDAYGRLIREQNAGSGAEIYRYGDGGQVSVTNAVGGITQLFFDHNGRLTRTIDPDGLTTETVYSADGLTSEVTEGLFAKSTYVYNEDGGIVSYTNALGHTIRTDYDEYGNIVSVMDENGSVTQYSYENGNVESITYSDGTVESYEYNILNQLTRYTDRNGASIRYFYDENGNLESKEYSDGTFVGYTYDDAGNVSSITDMSGTTQFAYDDAGNVTRVTYGDGRSIGYVYDDAGRTIRMTDDEGIGTNYVYDSVGRLTKLTDDSGNLIVRYSYDKMSRLVRKTNGNGTSTAYTYTPGGSVSRLVNYAADGSVNSEFTYRYDRFGNISEIETAEGTYRYEYDLMNQLTAAEDTDGTVTRYTYDASGSRISETTDTSVTYYTANELNQYTKIGSTRYSYDAAGNLIAKTDENGTTTYAYDIDGNLVGVDSPLGVWEYTYNSMGLRTSMTADGEVTTYLNDMSGLGNVAAEYRDGEVTKYVHGLGLEMLSRDGEEYFYDSDMRGSVVALTDADGHTVSEYSYSPFGEVTVLSEEVRNPFRYTGRYGIMDDGSGLLYVRERYYDPAMGRFLTLDNYGQNISTNGYLYSMNNPILYADIDGDVAFLVPLVMIGAGALIGAGVNTAVGYMEGKRGWDLGVAALSGAVSGGIGGGLALTPAGGFLAAAAPFISAGAGSLISNGYELWKKDISVGEALRNFAVETLFGGFIGGKLGDLVGKFIPINKGAITRITKLATIFFGKSMGNWAFNTLLGELLNKLFEKLPELGKSLWEFFMEIFGSMDPNDIIGPASYGDANWVAADAKLDYMIRCENDPEFATAPVHFLTITHELDDSLDLRTFRLGSYGFGGLVFEVPENKALYQTRLDLREEMDLYVDVWAGLDIVSGIATWTFTAIDPETGTIPSDPLIGFLPVNNKETGDGEGFVTYTIQPKKTAETGEIIDAVATIVFDNNAPIDTPKIFNTIDAEKPQSELLSAVSISSDETVLEWTADDNADGSGYAGADVYVSVDMAPFVLASTVLNERKAIIGTEPGRTYEFYVRARDNAGNTEEPKDEPEQSVDTGFVMQTVSAPVVKTLLDGAADSLQLIELTTETDGADIFYTTDGEIPTTASAKYLEPFAIEDLTTIRAVAVKQGMRDSEVTEFFYEAPKPVIGDVNGDGRVSDADAELLSLYFAGEDVSIDELLGAMIDGDEELTRRDAMILARYLAEWDGYALPYVPADSNG